MKLSDYPTLTKAFEMMLEDASPTTTEIVRKSAYEAELEPRELFDHAEQELSKLVLSELEALTEIGTDIYAGEDIEKVLDALFDLGWTEDDHGKN